MRLTMSDHAASLSWHGHTVQLSPRDPGWSASLWFAAGVELPGDTRCTWPIGSGWDMGTARGGCCDVTVWLQSFTKAVQWATATGKSLSVNSSVQMDFGEHPSKQLQTGSLRWNTTLTLNHQPRHFQFHLLFQPSVSIISLKLSSFVFKLQTFPEEQWHFSFTADLWPLVELRWSVSTRDMATCLRRRNMHISDHVGTFFIMYIYSSGV